MKPVVLGTPCESVGCSFCEGRRCSPVVTRLIDADRLPCKQWPISNLRGLFMIAGAPRVLSREPRKGRPPRTGP